MSDSISRYQQARGPAAMLGTVAALLMILLPAAGQAGVTTDALLEQAAAHAREAAEQAFPDGEVSVRMVPLDPRLALDACEDLQLETRNDRLAGRIAIHARCLAPRNWGLYLTAQVDVLLPIVTVARPVPRGTVLRRGDLTLETQNLGELREGYLTDIDTAAGMAARTNLRADNVLYQRQLDAPKLVTRGDTVMLASSQGHVRVTTQAIALSDGVYGEQIEVRNPRSDRVLTAWVTGRGAVTVRP